MGNDQRCTTLHDGFQCILYVPFRFRIEGRCCLVQDQHRCVFQQGPCNGQSLALAAGKHHAVVTNHGIQTFRHTLDEFQRMGLGRRISDLLATAVAEGAIGNVGRNGVVEKNHVLGHQRNL